MELTQRKGQIAWTPDNFMKEKCLPIWRKSVLDKEIEIVVWGGNRGDGEVGVWR